MKKIINGVAKPKPKTRDQLVAEVGVLDELIKVVAREDEDRRRDLSEMLGSFDIYKDEYSRREERKVRTLSWNGIIFQMGELKADADYAMMLERGRIKDKEIDALQNEIFRLKNPDDKTAGCGCENCVMLRRHPMQVIK